MDKDKTKRQRRLRHTIGWRAYWFPNTTPSGFNLEAPFSLEIARERLSRLERVRMLRGVRAEESLANALVEGLLSGPPGGIRATPTQVQTAPIQVEFVPVDDDTLRYQIHLFENRFSVWVRGYLKRWEQSSTLMTGQIRFGMHYTGLLILSLIYAVVGAGLTAVALLLLSYTPLTWMLFSHILEPLLLGFYSLLLRPAGIPLALVVFWLLALAAVWFNQVVLLVHNRRCRLVTRIEDLLLFPDLLPDLEKEERPADDRSASVHRR